MSNPSRRIVLAAAGTGAAAAAALASAPGASAANHTSPDAAEPAGEPLVAYIEDVASGRLSILFGEEEVVVQDADLVRRLTRAARR